MFISIAGDNCWNNCILFGNPVGMNWNYENVGKRNILIACELRNTGTRTIFSFRPKFTFWITKIKIHPVEYVHMDHTDHFGFQ